MIDRIKADNLRDSGFVIVSEGHARHKVKDSWRHLCTQCGDWVKQVMSKEGKLVCSRCLKV